MHIRSLHTHVNIVLIILTVILMVQVVSTYNSFSALILNQVKLSQLHSNVGAIYELERDVIDVQRNLLIYKQTGSASSIQGFHLVIDSVNQRIKNLGSEVGDDDSFLIAEEIFSRMAGHIEDYKENFTSVINAKLKQKKSIEKIERDIKKIESNFEYNKQSVIIKIQGNMVTLNQSMNNYLKTLDIHEIDIFNGIVVELNDRLKNVNRKEDVDTLNKIKKEFKRLVQLNRGYLYLVNVVMAGSASEFLFLTKKIREKAIEKQNAIEDTTYLSSRNTQFVNGLIGSLFIFIMLLMSWFLSKRILLPIRNITSVFNLLSKGEDVSVIPNIHHKNEIGKLARAAEVFHKNNKLTKKLLVESQQMIENQKIMNVQLEKQKKRAEVAAESKSMFLANMSHEIRTPMNGIVGLVDLVSATELTIKQRKYVERIAYSGQIMMNVINDILDFSKIEAGKMQIETVEFDINDIIENVIASILSRVKERSLDFKVWVTPSVPTILKGDPLRISQILLNLASNSIKFTEQGSIAIKFDYVDNLLCFNIHDTGIGMNAQQVSTIFESFTQADGSTSRKYGGTGLGLTIVKQLVALMNGDITIESSVDVGTDVFVRIDCQPCGTQCVLTPLENPSPLVHYIGRKGRPSALKYVLQNLNITLKDVSQLSRDSNEVGASPDYTLVIFEGLEALDTPALTRCLQTQARLFCILNSNEYDDNQHFKAFRNITKLQHPFSPKQYQQFLQSIFDFKNDDAVLPSTDTDLSPDMAGHVLLVEDNEINQLVAGDMLSSLGMTFDLAENGLEAIEAVNAVDYDLVLMDVQMPKMDGYTATQKLRESGKLDVIICGLSANALPEDLERAKQAGMNDYLTKPLKQDSLKSLLAKYLTPIQ